MAQFSRPQPGLFPADGDDCGAYTANEWVPVLIAQNRSGGMMVTGAAAPPGLPATQLFPNIGVYYATADRLAVTSPGAAQISIAVGAAIVDGRVFTNDTAITATAITLPAANPRIDRVVVRQNYTVADYTSVNAPALIVDANTARLCIISGAEAPAPVAPTLTQDEDRLTYWDIPLYQYQISNVGGVITGLTDEREWVDAETKNLWVNAIVGYDFTGAAQLNLLDSSGAGTPCIQLDDTTDSRGNGRFMVPNDFISTMTATPVITPSINGLNIYVNNYESAGTCGEGEMAAATSTGYTAVTTVSTGVNTYQCLTTKTISIAAAVGDFVVLYFRRDATNDPPDTYNGNLRFQGWHVSYFGWGRR